MGIEDIKLREVNLFLSLLKLKSVRELGRQENMQPGQVSKWIASLERKVGSPLIVRSASGIRPTARAVELLPIFEKMHTLGQKLNGETVKNETNVYSFASSSFFSTHLIPLIITGLKDDTKIKMIDLAPTNFIPAALRGAFEFCLHSRKLDWPQTWTTREVGSLKWHIYARKKHPILKNPGRKSILKYPFVIPIFWTPDGTQYGDDQCPIPLSQRIKGHETATAASAAEIVKATDQLAFLPEILARRPEFSLEVVKMPGKAIEKPVYLSVKNTTVKQSDFDLMTNLCKKVLMEHVQLL
jgi:DNA-binding transcriptional LysR family regulator